jgi:hypothetical protein
MLHESAPIHPANPRPARCLAFISLLSLVFWAGCSFRSHSTVSSTSNSTAHSKANQPAAWSTDEQLEFTYRNEDGKAIFDSEAVTIVFLGLSEGERKSFFFQGGKIALQISGEGNSESRVDCRNNFSKAQFRSVYQNGENTITFCGRQVRLVEKGKVTQGDNISSSGDPATRKNVTLVHK